MQVEDAGREGGGGPTGVVPMSASQLPRPKAPPKMPLGAFQTCGVYDGPICEMVCKGGNCRQECDGVECVFKCPDGYCSQLCGAEARCKMTCGGGHCVQACAKSEGCTKECTGGDCR